MTSENNYASFEPSDKHVLVRVPWHDNGWDGRICERPYENYFCEGPHSFMAEFVKDRVDREHEAACAGCQAGSTAAKGYVPPCIISTNAFNPDPLAEPFRFEHPALGWFNDKTPVHYDIASGVVVTWPYKLMYGMDDKNEAMAKRSDKRLTNAKAYNSHLQTLKSRGLVFFYTNDSNPFQSETRDAHALVVGLSRLKKVFDLDYYQGRSINDERVGIDNALVWGQRLQIDYPNQGFRIPFHRFQDRPEILERLALIPSEHTPFAFGGQLTTDDQALELIEGFIGIVTLLQAVDINPATGLLYEDWTARLAWLRALYAELWQGRGAFPGLPRLLNHLQAPSLAHAFIVRRDLAPATEPALWKEVIEVMHTGKAGSWDIPAAEAAELKRQVRGIAEQTKRKSDADSLRQLIQEVLPRVELSAEQIGHILSVKRAAYGLTAPLVELADNPYLIGEEYESPSDNNVSFFQLDRAVLPDPQLGVQALKQANDVVRLRALVVHLLRRVNNHTYLAADQLLEAANAILDRQAPHRQTQFFPSDLTDHKDFLTREVAYRYPASECLTDEDRESILEGLQLQLRRVNQDEMLIGERMQALAERTMISPRLPHAWDTTLKAKVKDKKPSEQAQFADIIAGQAAACARLFTSPLGILIGAAGTGKTTVINALVSAVKREDATAKILLLAPTGKAAQRMQELSGLPAATIHSMLAHQQMLLGSNRFARECKAPLSDYDTLIVDECSMIDTALLAALIRAVEWGGLQRLLLIGDPAQLPPIGLGKPFIDIVEWAEQHFPQLVARLDHNARQRDNEINQKGTAIPRLASLYRRMPAPESLESVADSKAAAERLTQQIAANCTVDRSLRAAEFLDLDIEFYNPTATDDAFAEAILQKMVKDAKVIIAPVNMPTERQHEKALRTLLAGGPDKAPWDAQAEKFQILAPLRAAATGTFALNQIVQEACTGSTRDQHTAGFRLGDKVVQLVNRTKSSPLSGYDWTTKRPIEKFDIYNGEVGIASAHPMGMKTKFSKGFRVQFSGKTRANKTVNYGQPGAGYCKPEDNLELAYALTVHKAQGSEFNRVYVVVPPLPEGAGISSSAGILSQELFYTALTRASDHLTVFLPGDLTALDVLRRRSSSAASRIQSAVFHLCPINKALTSNSLSWAYSLPPATQHTLDVSLLVRSRAEVIIANFLLSKNVVFEYERRLRSADGKSYLPDFTLKAQGQTFYLEHVGMLSDPKYASDWQIKERWYQANFPGQLLCTFDGNDISTQIQELYHKHLKE